jgi:DNA-binding NarL/FixJ family response regulator
MNVLLIDDQKEFREALRNAIVDLGPSSKHNIFEAENASTGLEILAKHDSIDIVVLDQVMGPERESGVEFLRRIPPSPSDRPRIIILTGHPDSTPIEAIRRLGRPIDFFLVKDVPFEVIAGAVKTLSASRKSSYAFGEEDVFGRLFCEELDETCRLLNEDPQLPKAARDLLNLIRSFVRTFLITGRRSAEEMFEYVVTFNEGASRCVGLQPRFVQLLQKWPEVERALYRIPAYRDHLIHQMKVFLLGFCIIAKMKSGIESRDFLGQKIGLHDNSWLTRWYLASAFHDLGYPFEKIGSWINSFFFDMLSRDGDSHRVVNVPHAFNWGSVLAHGDTFRSFVILVERIAKDHRATDMQRSELERRLSELLLVKAHHAVVGGVVLTNMFGIECGVEPGKAAFLHDREVAGAVMKCVGHPLEIIDDPIACILAFCDTAQEWGRVKPMDVPQTVAKFGVPLFHSLRFEQGIRLELIYPVNFSTEGQEFWSQHVRNKILTPFESCWDAGGRFHITYYWRDHADKMVVLDRLEI